jgi:hypothetical protein
MTHGLAPRPAVRLLGLAVPVRDRPAVVDRDDRDVHLVEQRRLRAHLLLGCVARGDVVVRHDDPRGSGTLVARRAQQEPAVDVGAVTGVLEEEQVLRAGGDGAQPPGRANCELVVPCGIAGRQVVARTGERGGAVGDREVRPGAVGHEDLARLVEDRHVRRERVQGRLIEVPGGGERPP